MSQTVQEVVIFIGSPSDLTDERRLIWGLESELNRFLLEDQTRVKVVGWEEQRPGFGRAQSLINPMVDKCDIFVGILHRKWGTGTGTHSSGFLEEFELAAERRQIGESPEMLMFFKEVDAETLREPSSDLRKVLDFKKRIEDEKLLLYSSFKEPQELIDNLRAALLQLIMKLSRRHEQPIDSPDEATTAMPVSEPKESTEGRGEHASADSAREQLSATLLAWNEMVSSQTIPSGSLDADRLLLISLAVSTDAGTTFPVHPFHRLYRRRNDLDLTVIEWELLVRTFVQGEDRGRRHERTQLCPGWFFFAHRRNFDPDALRLLVKIVVDESGPLRAGAFDVLSQLRLRPAELWSSPPAELPVPDQAGSLVAKWRAVFESDPESGLAYISAVATLADRDMLMQIADQVPDARVSLTAFSDSLLGRHDALAVLASSSYSKVARWLRLWLLPRIGILGDDALNALVCGRHTSQSLRFAALSELAVRNAITPAVFADALLSKITANRTIAARWAISAPAELVLEAVSLIPDDKRTDSDIRFQPILLAVSETRESLVAMAANAIRAHDALDALSIDSVDEEIAQLARDTFDTSSSLVELAAQANADLATDPKVMHYLEASIRASCLRVLSKVDRPNSEDAERARLELRKDDWFSAGAASQVLARSEDPLDAELILQAKPAIRIVEYPHLVDSALRLGGLHCARTLVSSEWIDEALKAANVIARDPDATDDELIDLLTSQHDQVRLVAIQALGVRWDIGRMETFLDEYMARPTYFYNVVAEIDRVLYAPSWARG